MKIEKNILKEYINKVSLGATIPTLNLNFTSDGVITRVRDVTNTTMIFGKLKKEAFEEYEEIGEIFIKDSRMFLNTLKTFEGIVELENVSKNLIRISNDKREVNITLAEEKICDNIVRKDRPEIETTVSIALDKDILMRAINDMALLDVNNVLFQKTGDKMVISIGSEREYDFIKNVVVCKEEGDVSVGVASAFKEVVSSISDNVILHLGNDLPLIFEDKNEHMETETFLSPFVECED